MVSSQLTKHSIQSHNKADICHLFTNTQWVKKKNNQENQDQEKALWLDAENDAKNK